MDRCRIFRNYGLADQSTLGALRATDAIVKDAADRLWAEQERACWCPADYERYVLTSIERYFGALRVRAAISSSTPANTLPKTVV